MSEKPPILVFDLDGTLADTAGDLVGTLNVILGGEGLPLLPLADGRKLIGAGARALIARGFSAAGRDLSSDELQRLFAAFIVRYEAHIADESKLFPGVEAVLDRFASAGFVLAVCTNKFERSSRLLLEALGVARRFQAICGQDTFNVAKPDARIFLSTVARAGGDPGRATMIGDSAADVATARAAGASVIAVDFGYSDAPAAELGADRVVSHFDELWGAVAELAARPRQIAPESPARPP
ncbi:MAG TPA: HAD-IA family hydrolase [Roseiarcus sp.]|nr:HAD-IA family hydrolase [Roseiarcus sp.]